MRMQRGLAAALLAIMVLGFPAKCHAQRRMPPVRYPPWVFVPRTLVPPPVNPAIQQRRAAAIRLVASKLEETLLLKEAYILLVSANHAYDGHRVKAMHAVHRAFRSLDDELNRQGNPAQILTNRAAERQVAAAQLAALRAANLHEPKAASDQKLTRAAEILLHQVRPRAVANHQPGILAAVDIALNEIGEGLKGA